MNTFAKMRANAGNSADALRKTLDDMNKSSSFAPKQAEENFWSLHIDKETKVGAAVIRFLPAPEGETANFVRYFSHGFQGPTGLWYIENSLATFDQPDPVAEMNRALWNSKDEKKIEIAKNQKRKLHHIANILVLKDPANPENEGKVFYFRFGPQILEKIKDAATKRDDLDDRELFDPFCLWEGANFKLRSKKKDKFASFENSEFDRPAQLFGKSKEDDEANVAMENVWKQARPLYKFVDPENKDMYKDYATLKARLQKVWADEAPAIGKAAMERTESPFKDDDEEIEVEADEEDADMKLFKSLKGAG